MSERSSRHRAWPPTDATASSSAGATCELSGSFPALVGVAPLFGA